MSGLAGGDGGGEETTEAARVRASFKAMDEIVKWIESRTPEQWSAFGAMLTAFIAVFATIFAWLQVRHARQLREDQAQPFVVVSFRPSAVWGHAINLVVENIGNTVAKDVRITFDQPLESKSRSMNINESQLFKEGIRVMPPRMKIETLFDLAHERYGADLPMTYMATVTYRGIRGKQETMEYTLDMGVFYGLETLTEYGMHHAAKSLIGIEKLLKSWTRSGRLRVSASDEDYHNWSDRWQHRRGGDTPSMGRPYPAGRTTPSKYDRLEESAMVRTYWAIRLPLQRFVERRAELYEDRRLAKAGRHDLVAARRQMRGES